MPLSWITVLWPMVAAVCLTLAGLHLLIWCRQRAAWGNVLFSLTATAAAVSAGLELWMMRAETPGEFGLLLRWMHVPAWVLTLSLVGFVRVYLRAGRPWLAWTACGLRTLSLVLNFVFTPNLNFREITSLRHLPFLGESVVVADGIRSPWMLIGQVSLALVVVFVVDAAVTVWRRGNRRQAILVGGSLVLFTLAATAQIILALWGVIHTPLTTSLFYLGIVVGMAYELSDEVLRAAKLSSDLGESEKRMALATGAAQLGMWFQNLERNEMWATDEWRALYGFTEAERLDLAQYWQRVHPEDREAVRRARTHAIEGNGSYEMEYRVVLPDGRMRWIDSQGRVELNAAGQAALVRGVSRDISLRKRSVDALRESEDRFRTVANAAPVMIWMSGTDKLCTFFNKGWLDFTGRTPEQELGHGWAEGVHREDFARCLEVYEQSFDARIPFEMEYRLRRRDGEYRWLLDNGTPRYSTDGSFLGYIGSCIDISARKLAEEAAHNLSGRLIHAQEETRKRFARELHDDLSQSLALLSVELEMFGQAPLLQPEKIAARMEEFSRQVRGLSSEVHQLSHDLHPAKLEQLGLVAAVRGFCQEFARAHELAIEFSEHDVPRNVPDAAALCLFRIAQEALQNAMKHSGATVVKVELAREDGHLRLAVVDDGMGFDPHVPRTNGSLGLVSMSERARFVGGSLTIESRSGAGTRVEVRVPFAEPQAHSPGEATR